MTSPTSTAGGRVLVVDDERIVALDLEDRLTQLGYTVVATAGTAEEAISAARRLRPELVLMDIRLRDGDGIDAAAAIKREHPVPIVFLTAFADDDTVGRAKQVCPDGYLIKPFDDRELQVVLELALFRARSEREVAARDALLHAVLRSLSEAVIAVAADGTIRFLNPAAATLIGIEAAAAAGRPVSEVLRIEGPPDRLALRDRLGLLRAVERTSRPMPDLEGLGGGEVLVLREVTATRREAERRALTARVSDALAAADDEQALLRGVSAELVSLSDWCLIDLVRHDGEISDSAFAQAETFRDASRLAAPSSARRHRDLSELLLEPGDGPALAAALGVASEDEAEPFMARAVLSLPIPGAHGPLGKLTLGLRETGKRFSPDDVAAVRDLSRRIGGAVEKAQLFRATTAAVRSRDDVLAIVSHDLRNPLATIQIGLDALRASAVASEPAVSRKLDVMRRAAARMRRLISDLLDVATIDSGTLSFKSHRESLTGLLQEAHESYAPLAREKGLELVFLPPSADVPLYCDRERIGQALGNVLGNALKFTPPGGRITLASQTKEGEVELLVADTGIGITPEQLPRIFERRWQAPQPGAPHLGSGLGLYITRGIVEGQGGRIWAESVPGKGTTFHLALPSITKGAPLDAPAHAP